VLFAFATAAAFDATSPACTGVTMQFDATLPDATDWAWTIDGLPAGGLDHVRWAFESEGAHLVELVATTPDGDVAEQMTVDVLPTPSATLAGPILVAAHEQHEYTATVDGAYVALRWTVEGGTLLGADGEPQARVEWGEVEAGRVAVQVDNGTDCTRDLDLDVEITLPADGDDSADTGDDGPDTCGCTTTPAWPVGVVALLAPWWRRRRAGVGAGPRPS